MKKCFYFPTWDEIKKYSVRNDEKFIQIFRSEKELKEKNIFGDIVEIMQGTSDKILHRLCELTGATMYGDYILLNKIKNDYLKNDIVMVGDVISSFDYYGENMSFYYTLVPDVYNYPFNNYVTKNNYVSSNIFEEYSKFLRKEENKWEDARKVLNIEL